MLWKLILTQYKTTLSQQQHIEKVQLNLRSKLPTEWKSLGGIYKNLNKAKIELKKVLKNMREIVEQIIYLNEHQQ